MIKAGARALFDLVESFFTKYLPQQRGASPHTIRAYRDALKLLLVFTAERCGCEVANLQLEHLNADIVAGFLDHIEAERSNSATTRNCRRAAIRGFFKHLVRNDLEHALQYTRVLALPAKKARQRSATLKLPMCGRSSPTQIDAPRTVGATTHFYCSFTTAGLESARRSARGGLICS